METKPTHKHSILRRLVGGLSLQTKLIIAAVVAVLALIVILVALNSGNHMTLGENQKIDITPTQIQSIEEIGQWELLSISDEEMVDTVRHGLFGDSELVRIYYGTIRLGVDMHEAKPKWITIHKDTLIATLPPIKLLDNDFIDEARTTSFFESGTWSNEAREELYQKAYRAMKKRCMTTKNMENARQNGELQFYNLFRAMGFSKVKIKFEEDKKHENK